AQQGLGQDIKVEPDRVVLQVVQLEVFPFVEMPAPRLMILSQASESMLVIQHRLTSVGNQRRSHKADFPTNDISEQGIKVDPFSAVKLLQRDMALFTRKIVECPSVSGG